MMHHVFGLLQVDGADAELAARSEEGTEEDEGGDDEEGPEVVDVRDTTPGPQEHQEDWELVFAHMLKGTRTSNELFHQKMLLGIVQIACCGKKPVMSRQAFHCLLFSIYHAFNALES